MCRFPINSPNSIGPLFESEFNKLVILLLQETLPPPTNMALKLGCANAAVFPAVFAEIIQLGPA